MIYIYKDNFVSRGLFAYFWTVVDAFKYLKNPEDALYISLINATPYYDTNYSKTNNVWEYYFQQPFLDIDISSETTSDIIVNQNFVNNLMFTVKNGRYVLDKDRDVINFAKTIIDKYIKIQPHIQDKLNILHQTLFSKYKVIGIHIRNGEHYANNNRGHGRHQQYLMDNEYYVKTIKSYIDDYDKVYVMSNDKEPRDYIRKYFGDSIIFYDHPYISDKNNIDTTWLFNNNNYDKGEAAVLEALLMGKCHHKLLVNSNLGFFSALYSNSPYTMIDKHIRYVS